MRSAWVGVRQLDDGHPATYKNVWCRTTRCLNPRSYVHPLHLPRPGAIEGHLQAHRLRDDVLHERVGAELPVGGSLRLGAVGERVAVLRGQPAGHGESVNDTTLSRSNLCDVCFASCVIFL